MPPSPIPPVSLRLGIIGIVAAELDRDLPGTLLRLSELGYQGLEMSWQRILQLGGADRVAEGLSAAGMELLTLMALKEQLRDHEATLHQTLARFSCRHLTIPHGSAESLDAIKQDAAFYGEAGARLHDRGVQLCYHNHEHEFRSRPRGTGHSAIDVLMDATTPETLALHLDVAWAAFGGADPVVVLERYSGRVPVVHLKDLYSLEVRGCFTCPGTGLLDLASILSACRRHGVKWATVEQDAPRRLRGLELAAAARHNLVELGLDPAPGAAP